MIKFAVSVLLLATLLQANKTAAQVRNYSIKSTDVFSSYIVEKIPLKSFAVPAVTLTQPVYIAENAAVKDPKTGLAQNFQLKIGMERKQPFLLVSIPAYSKDATGTLQRLSGFSLDIKESAVTATPNLSAYAKTTSVNAPLATGNWYKIAVPARGVYKIDYNFIQSKLGVNPSSVNPANIRIFGNGGTMLSENNAIDRPSNLMENAIYVSASGSTLASGDYILFYANGPMAWDKDSVNQKFVHRKNLYADSSYYFINFDQGAGKRMSTQTGTLAANETITSYNDYQAHEVDSINLGKIGKEWWGENFGTLPSSAVYRDFSFPFGSTVDSVSLRMMIGSRSSVSGSAFSANMNGQNLSGSPYVFGAIDPTDGADPIAPATISYKLPVNSTNASFHLAYTPAVYDALGYLNYIELNYRRSLSFVNSQMNFRDWQSVGAGKVAEYKLQNANSYSQVWDITNPLEPVKMNGSLGGSTYSFAQDAAVLHEFVTLDGSQYGTPYYIGTVANQNIHGNAAVDLVIVTYPGFIDAANKLADQHRQHDNMRVLVATTTQVYNEFSSGGQDIGAIRDMMRMFYDNAGADSTQLPKYLLLFGDASYDYKNRLSNNSNYVPTFECAESISMGNTFTVDDFYGFLDDNENIENTGIPNTLDIGIGRLPVSSETQAEAVVSKIINYSTNPLCLGPWRIANTYIGDNEDDAGAHLEDAEDMCATVDATTKIYNDTKIYLDNLPFVSTPGGARCPDANKAITDQIFKGTFLMNYNGHGSTVTLAHERILTADDFNTWKNINKLPFMVTATCDYSRYDDPAYVSDGEQLILKADGGTIAMLTTTAAVYASINHMINVQFLQAQFNQHQDNWYTFGDAVRLSKNATYGAAQLPDPGTLINFRRFVLLGDPALQPSFPKNFVHTDSIIDVTTNTLTDTLRALGTYTIKGSVNDVNNNNLSGFNGKVYVTIYDKPRTITLYTKVYNTLRSYKVQDNIVYKGIATVTAGHFSVTFIAPKDLNYDFGNGKISYYAENGVTDAAGSDFGKTVGGYTDSPSPDLTGPVVKPYMNDTLFRDGAITGSNTALYVKLFDESGINVTGNSVGHDLTAILDDDVADPYILNDYYETEPNTYKYGHVSFPVAGLSDGKHKFTVKAWDVYNNSGTGVVNFIVGNGKVIDIQNLMNYPNPFSDITHFVFEHNHPGEELNVKIAIYSISGTMVKLIEATFTPDGSHSNTLTWDGTDKGGAKLPNGVYPYRLILSTDSGIQSSAYQKLVLLR